jgi:hypothetical protein
MRARDRAFARTAADNAAAARDATCVELDTVIGYITPSLPIGVNVASVR